MSTQSANNKRIAKNTLLLYFRMLLTMVVSLYTSRVVLGALGVEDYGIYNVVGGVVAMFSMLSGSLSAAISRFITFELGRKNYERLHKVFCTSINVQLILILILIVLLETVGLWFLNYKMVIPEGRLSAANWVFQLSLITFAVNLLSVPYNAAIVAHEKMEAFAYISIVEAISKLMIAYIIVISTTDKLILYSIMLTLIAIVVRILYGIYCKKKFIECTYRFIFDRLLLKQMFEFSGWNFFGAGSWQLMTQGVNILLNIYFGVSVNAARGIATQVDQAILQFVNNFTTAINPQIIKSYASKNFEYMYSLINQGAKFSFFLILFFAIPFIFETNIILKLWLNNVPKHTVVFVRLAITASMLHVLSNTMVTAMLATGNIKRYQIIVGGFGMMVFPLAWILFYFGFPPEMSYLSTILIFIIQLVFRLKLMKSLINMPINSFIKEVIFKALIVFLFSIIAPLIVVIIMEESILRLFIVGIVSLLSTCFIIISIGLNYDERIFLIKRIKYKL